MGIFKIFKVKKELEKPSEILITDDTPKANERKNGSPKTHFPPDSESSSPDSPLAEVGASTSKSNIGAEDHTKTTEVQNLSPKEDIKGDTQSRGSDLDPSNTMEPAATAVTPGGSTLRSPHKGGTVVDTGDWKTSETFPQRHVRAMDVKPGNQEKTPRHAVPPTPSSEGVADDEMTEEQEDARALLVASSVYSAGVMYKITSSQWAERRSGVELVKRSNDQHVASLIAATDERELSSEEKDELQTRFVVLCSILKRAFKDRVAPVCFAAFEAFRSALEGYAEFIDGNKDASAALSKLVPFMIEKMNGEATGTNRRMQHDSAKCLMQLAESTELGGLNLIVPFLTLDSVPIRPRLRLLKTMIAKFGFAKSSALRLTMVMSVAIPALQISDDKTRKAAVYVVVGSYAIVGNRVRKHLSSIKPAMLKILERKFAETDAKKAATQQMDGNSGVVPEEGLKRAYLAPLAPIKHNKNEEVGKTVSCPEGDVTIQNKDIDPLSSNVSDGPTPKQQELLYRKNGGLQQEAQVLYDGTSYNMSRDDEVLMNSIIGL